MATRYLVQLGDKYFHAWTVARIIWASHVKQARLWECEGDAEAELPRIKRRTGEECRVVKYGC